MIQSKKIIKVAFILILLGSAFRYFLFDTPLRIFFWNEENMKPILNLIGIQWEDYANNTLVDKTIVIIGKIIASFLLICGLVIAIKDKVYQLIIYILTFIFLLFAILTWKDNFYHLPFLLEQSIFCFTGIIYLKNQENKSLVLFTKIIIALTFIGHGLYALNIYNIPGEFVQLTMNATGYEEEKSKLFLKLFGFFDLIFSFLLFSSKQKWVNIGLIYCVLWGFLTAFSRIVGHYHEELGIHSLDEYWHECIIRIPNGLVPLFLYVKAKKG